jgi:hypothetical protein
MVPVSYRDETYGAVTNMDVSSLYPWEDLHLSAWAAPTFASPNNMSPEVGQLAAAMTQVKLCPYEEVLGSGNH